MPVHDVEVQPIGASFFRAMDLGFEIGEIGGENRRSNENFFAGHKSVAEGSKTSNAEPPTSNPELFDIPRCGLGPALAGAFPQNLLCELSLDDRRRRFMLSRSQAGSVDWNARSKHPI